MALGEVEETGETVGHSPIIQPYLDVLTTSSDQGFNGGNNQGNNQGNQGNNQNNGQNNGQNNQNNGNSKSQDGRFEKAANTIADQDALTLDPNVVQQGSASDGDPDASQGESASATLVIF